MKQPSVRDELIGILGEVVVEYPPVLLLGLVAGALYLLARQIYKSDAAR